MFTYCRLCWMSHCMVPRWNDGPPTCICACMVRWSLLMSLKIVCASYVMSFITPCVLLLIIASSDHICVSDGLVLTFGPPYLLFLIPLSPVTIHREEQGKRISIVLDMSNAGLSNVDIPFISFLVNLFKFYYPDMLNSIIVFEMPWIMNGKLAVTCLHITYFNFFTRTILLLL